MVDSTYQLAPETQGGTFAERWNAERRMRTAVRKALTARIDASCVDAVMQQFDKEGAPHAMPSSPASQFSAKAGPRCLLSVGH